MKRHSRDIGILLSKLRTPLHEHLQLAIDGKKIGAKYELPKKKNRKETIENYAHRLFQDSVSYQFIRVVNNGECNYVAFGVPGPIITKFGKFFLIPAQVVNGRWGIHHVLIYPNLDILLEHKDILIRFDSGCISGQLFGDQTCDCKQQYETTLKLCTDHGLGVIINIPGHDGRGWMEFKMANQQLMDECGLDTVAAAKVFYEDHDAIDQRTYTEAVLILKALGFTKDHNFQLATNNPRKMGAFTSLGMNLTKRQPVIPKIVNPVLKKNLEAKSREWRHEIDFESTRK